MQVRPQIMPAWRACSLLAGPPNFDGVIELEALRLYGLPRGGAGPALWHPGPA
jgi:hypothetical protein